MAPAGRIASLDSIRGLAAFAVLLGHSVATFAWSLPLTWTRLPVLNILFDGRSAVTMFFVLSGFVLTRPHFSSTMEAPRRLDPLSFYIRRFTRIWIPWIFVFALSALAQVFLFHTPATHPPISEWLASFWHFPLTLSSILRQCAFLVHDTGQVLLPQDWSLGVELKCSLLTPLFLFLVRKHVLWLTGFSVFLLLWLPSGAYYFSFAVGVLTARFYPQVHAFVSSFRFPAKCWLLIGGIALYQLRLPATILTEMNNTQDKVVWCMASVGCVAIILASLASKRIQSVLNHAAMVYLGRISYSVYLLQFLVILCVLPPLLHVFNGWGLQNDKLAMPIMVFTSIVVTLALSAVTFRVIEVPCIAWGHWLTNAIPQRWPRAPRAAK